MSLDDWLAEATPRQARVPVCFDGELLSRYEEAKARAIEKTLEPMLGDEKKMEARAEVERLKAEVKEKTHVFVFESIGWGRWRDLVSKHPPKDGDLETWERAIQMKLLPRGFETLESDETTFIPAVMVATCVEPGFASTGKAMEFIESVANTTGIMTRIWAGIDAANHGGMSDPFVGGFIDSEQALATERK